MKLIFLLMIFSFSVVYAEPKTIDNSPKLCLETIYKKNFDAVPENEVDDYYCIFKKYDTKEVEMTDVKF